jgi:putative oxidoreductase
MAMSGIQSLAALIGRILLSAVFLASGVQKVFAWSETAKGMAAEGMFWVPLFLVVAILCEVGGGLSVLWGWYARLGAFVLIVFLIPVTGVYHDFWTYEGKEQQMQMIHFSKNLAIMGGLFVLIAAGAGRYSLRRRAT